MNYSIKATIILALLFVAIILLNPGTPELNTMLIVICAECIALLLTLLSLYILKDGKIEKYNQKSVGLSFLGVHICVGLTILGVYLAQC